MTSDELDSLVGKLSPGEREVVLRLLRDRYKVPVHSLEAQWNTTAEVILEAIQRSGDLVQRGVRGVIAEATFRTTVLPSALGDWREIPIEGEEAYDLLVADGRGQIRIQVKLQRREAGRPMLYRKRTDTFVVETQRTRSGKRSNSEPSRPYRIDEFDLLAVCLHPSTGKWTDFYYCATRDLLTRPTSAQLLAVMQPFPAAGSDVWTTEFARAALRFRS